MKLCFEQTKSFFFVEEEAGYSQFVTKFGFHLRHLYFTYLFRRFLLISILWSQKKLFIYAVQKMLFLLLLAILEVWGWCLIVVDWSIILRLIVKHIRWPVTFPHLIPNINNTPTIRWYRKAPFIYFSIIVVCTKIAGLLSFSQYQMTSNGLRRIFNLIIFVISGVFFKVSQMWQRLYFLNAWPPVTMKQRDICVAICLDIYIVYLH